MRRVCLIALLALVVIAFAIIPLKEEHIEKPERYAISPYDTLIKKHSDSIDWDWRLVSALMHRESKFDTTARSPRGAVGLMQVMEKTAKSHGITDIHDPEQNIIAGIKILAALEKRYKRMGVREPELHKIVLGAYNAGEGRMSQLMQVAKAEGKTPYVWDTLVSVLPLMAEGYTLCDTLEFPPFKGSEMVRHVEMIEKQFQRYKRKVAK